MPQLIQYFCDVFANCPSEVFAKAEEFVIQFWALCCLTVNLIPYSATLTFPHPALFVFKETSENSQHHITYTMIQSLNLCSTVAVHRD